MPELTFEVVVSPDTEAGGFVAEVPVLPGCYSQGDTEEECLENIVEAIVGCLEVRSEEGIYPFFSSPVPMLRKVKVPIDAAIAARAIGASS